MELIDLAAGWNKGIKHSKETRQRISQGMSDYWQEHKEERIDELQEKGRRLAAKYNTTLIRYWNKHAKKYAEAVNQQNKNTLST